MQRGWNELGHEESITPSLFDGSVQDKRDQLRQEARYTGDGSRMPYGSDAREWMKRAERKERTMLTAIEAAKMRNATPYTLREIETDIRRLANITSRAYGYAPERMPQELIDTLVAHGYEVSKDESDGSITISWYQATANELIAARKELEGNNDAA